MRNLFLPLLMMAIFGGYFVFMKSKAKQAIAGLGPAMHAYFARTGYRYPDMPPEPVEAHAQRAMSEAQNPAAFNGNQVTRYVRNFHGLPILFEQAYRRIENGNSLSVSWSAQVPAPPRVPFQVADKSLAGVGKAVREAFSNMTRNWSPRLPQPVQLGIPELDARFMIYGVDPNAVRMLFQQNPALGGLLLQCVEVDLCVDASGASFADPLQKNMNAAMGGTMGSMALGFDLAKRMELSIPVHDRMAELLALSVRAAA